MRRREGGDAGAGTPARAARATAELEPIGLSSKTRTKAASIASTFGLSAADGSPDTRRWRRSNRGPRRRGVGEQSADANPRVRARFRVRFRSSQRSAAAVFVATVADSLRTRGRPSSRRAARHRRERAERGGRRAPWRSAPVAASSAAAIARATPRTDGRRTQARLREQHARGHFRVRVRAVPRGSLVRQVDVHRGGVVRGGIGPSSNVSQSKL